MLLQDDDERRKGRRDAYSPVSDEGPGLAACVTSIALHFVVLVAFVAAAGVYSDQARTRPHTAVLLTETRLVDPHLAFALGTAGQGHKRPGATMPASRGITPLPAFQRSLRAATKIPTVRSPIQISPTPPELAVQLTQDLTQYGNPSGNSALSILTSVPSGTVDGFGNGPSGGQGDHSHGPVLTFSALSQWPTVLYKVEPDYSEAARKAKCEGIVVLKLVIDETGLPRDIRVVRGLGLGLDEKAIEAVHRWRFRPGYQGSEPVAVAANVELDFKLL